MLLRFNPGSAKASIAAFAAGTVLAAAAHAQDPDGQMAALIYDIADAPSATFQSFDELPVNAEIDLRPRGRMTFLHFGKCAEVEISGGTVTIEELRYTASEDAAVTQFPADCPALAASVDNQLGGAVIRSGDDAPETWLATRPRLVVASGEVAGVVMREPGAPEGIVLEREGRVWQLPDAADALSPGAYSIDVQMGDATYTVSGTIDAEMLPMGDRPTVIVLDEVAG